MRFSELFIDPAQHAVGLDVTGQRLRSLRLRRSGSRAIVIGAHEGATLTGSIQSGSVTNVKALASGIRSLLAPIKATAAFVIIPEQHAFVKTFDLPEDARSDEGEAVRWEAAQYIPFDLNELYLDSQSRQSDGRTRATVTAAPKNVVDPFVQALDQAGIVTLSIEPPSLAAVRLLEQQQLTPLASALVLVLGETEGAVVVLENGQPMFSASLPSSTTRLEERLAERFSLSPKEAHETRVLIGISNQRAAGLVRKALLEDINALAQRVLDIVGYCADHGLTREPPSSIVALGPGAETVGLTDVLASVTHIPTSVAKPPLLYTNGRTKNVVERFHEYALAYAAAARGLSLS